MSDIISVKNLSKSYGKNQVLDNVSFKLEEGQIIGLLGPNGCGKTSHQNSHRSHQRLQRRSACRRRKTRQIKQG